MGEKMPAGEAWLRLYRRFPRAWRGRETHRPAAPRRGRGAAAVEYMLIMIFVVLPLALLLPLFLTMIRTYAVRIIALLGLPFP